MVGRNWTTPAQFDFLETFRIKYQEHQEDGRYVEFWPIVFQRWSEEYPERNVVYPNLDVTVELTDAQKKVLVDATVKRQRVRYPCLVRRISVANFYHSKYGLGFAGAMGATIGTPCTLQSSVT